MLKHKLVEQDGEGKSIRWKIEIINDELLLTGIDDECNKQEVLKIRKDGKIYLTKGIKLCGLKTYPFDDSTIQVGDDTL